MLDRTSPAAIISAPNTTVQRTPIFSATWPIAIPPPPEPSQASEYDSAGTDRTLPNSDAIGFSATMVMIGAPNETERMPSAVTATTQERRVSMVPAAVVPRPATDAVVIAIRCYQVSGIRLALWPRSQSDCGCRLDRMDHVDGFSGIDQRGVEIPARRRGIARALGKQIRLQRLLAALRLSPHLAAVEGGP